MKARLHVEFHPEAVAEALAARDWYAAREPSLGAAFVHEVEQAVRRIEDAPTRWPALDRETRRVSLRRFPYLLIYRALPLAIQVLAVAHAHRRPSYWRKRRRP